MRAPSNLPDLPNRHFIDGARRPSVNARRDGDLRSRPRRPACRVRRRRCRRCGAFFFLAVEVRRSAPAKGRGGPMLPQRARPYPGQDRRTCCASTAKGSPSPRWLDSGKTINEARGDVGCGALLRLLRRRRGQERGSELPARRGLRLLLDQRAGRRRRRTSSPGTTRCPRRRGASRRRWRRRLHGSRQAGRADADDGPDAGGTAEQGRPARRRLQRRDRHRRCAVGAPLVANPAGRARHLHRIDRDRLQRDGRRGRGRSHR